MMERWHGAGCRRRARRVPAPVRHRARGVRGGLRRRRGIGRTLHRLHRRRHRDRPMGGLRRPRAHPRVRRRHPDPALLHHQGGGGDVGGALGGRGEARLRSARRRRVAAVRAGREGRRHRPTGDEPPGGALRLSRPHVAGAVVRLGRDLRQARRHGAPVAARDRQRLSPRHLRLHRGRDLPAGGRAHDGDGAARRLWPGRWASTCGSDCRTPSTTASRRWSGQRRCRSSAP